MARVYFSSFKFKGNTVPAGSYETGTRAEEIDIIERRGQKKQPGAVSLTHHLWELDKTWRDLEGRKPFDQLTDREKMLEGAIPWNPELLKESTLQS